jgi:hypothetical protein
MVISGLLLATATLLAKPARPVRASDTNWVADDTVPHVNVIVRGPQYKGVIFDTIGNYHYKFKHGLWLPVPREIALAESLIAANADSFLKQEPGIRAALGQYLRQYVGYVDEKGERCVFVNLFCGSVLEKFPDWDYTQVARTEGGECFWEINVNLARKRVFGLVVSLK